MDVRQLKYEPNSFDVAIDKGWGIRATLMLLYGINTAFAGTMDAMMTAKGDVWVRCERLYLKVDHKCLTRVTSR